MTWPATPRLRRIRDRGRRSPSLSAQPGVVEEVGGGQRQVHVPGLADRLAAVQALAVPRARTPAPAGAGPAGTGSCRARASDGNCFFSLQFAVWRKSADRPFCG
jgi:hypothetical protein